MEDDGDSCAVDSGMSGRLSSLTRLISDVVMFTFRKVLLPRVMSSLATVLTTAQRSTFNSATRNRAFPDHVTHPSTPVLIASRLSLIRFLPSLRDRCVSSNRMPLYCSACKPSLKYASLHPDSPSRLALPTALVSWAQFRTPLPD